jgi:uncharacterized BrkB/YihY/UPF0761 family membrane protein
MGRYFNNPFVKPNYATAMAIVMVLTVFPLSLFKVLTLGAFQMEVFYEDVGSWLQNKGFTE